MESLLSDVSRWLDMGGYAVFVWPAYAVAGAVLGGLAWRSWRAHRAGETALGRLQRRAGSESGGAR